jgi:Rad3-related DNA helicase
MAEDDPYGVVAAFPRAPYGIQREFMVALYEALDKGQIGLFESPTGVCVCVLRGGD